MPSEPRPAVTARGQVLPDFYRPGAASSLGPDDPVEVSGGSALVLLVRVNICAQRQRAAVGVAELRGDERLSGPSFGVARLI